MSQKFYCKYCGFSYPSVMDLRSNACSRHPIKGSKHELYEGSEKSQYTCKYCGFQYSSIAMMTANHCPKHPNKGLHEPAL